MTETYPWAWYSDPAVLARRARADLPRRVALRRPRGTAARAVLVLRLHDRRAAGGRHPRPRGRAARLPQRLPPPRLGDRLRRRPPRDAPVPVPRVDVRPRRRAALGAAGRPRAGLRRVRARSSRSGSSSGGRSCSSAPTRTRRRRRRLFAAARLPFDPAALVFRERVDYALEANWKIAVENYLECYHCPVAHPGFSRSSTSIRTPTSRGGRPGLEPVRPRADGERQCAFHLVWPALKINVYPGLANLSIGPVWPESPGRTVGFLDYFFGPDVDEALGDAS